MPLKVLILCAGYGTRLERDLQTSEQYSHLLGVPKPLLPIGDKPLISHWIGQVCERPCGVDGVIIVTNDSNKRMFEDWREQMQRTNEIQIDLLSDGTNTNEGRLGATACIQLVVEHFSIDKSGHDLIVIGGDTLFYEDVRISSLIESYHNFKSVDSVANMVLGCPCAEANVHKHGILEVGPDDRVVDFLEKPKLEDTASRIQCPCFYILGNTSLHLLEQFLVEKKDEPLQARDAPGNFIRYIIKRAPVFCQQVSGRFDVGGLESYIDCCRYFQDQKSSS